MTENSVEQRIVELLHEKRMLFEDYVEGAAAEGVATVDALRLVLGLTESENEHGEP